MHHHEATSGSAECADRGPSICVESGRDRAKASRRPECPKQCARHGNCHPGSEPRSVGPGVLKFGKNNNSIQQLLNSNLCSILTYVREFPVVWPHLQLVRSVTLSWSLELTSHVSAKPSCHITATWHPPVRGTRPSSLDL